MLLLIVLFGFGLRPDHAIAQSEEATAGPAFAPDRLLVKIDESAPADAIETINRKNDAHVKEKIPHSRVSVVDLPEDLSVAEAVEVYEASPEIEYAEPDYLVHTEGAIKPNDPSFSKMYGLDNTGQYSGTPDADIDAPEAWGAMTAESASSVVAVIDTGVDISHPDLRNNIWTNPDEIAGNGKDDDHNGYVDDVHGWDFYYNDASVFDSATDDWHGTHVAGTIAAETNNGIGISGVTPRAKVMPLKFFGPGEQGWISDAVEALNYAVAEGVMISNNSWGGGRYSLTLLDALKKADAAGHLFFAAAMNGGEDKIGDNTDLVPCYPASYDSLNVVSVAATDQRDALTSFSNYGATSVDLAAPGSHIYSTLPNNAYGYGSGTSMATPHVAGVAALLKSNFPELDDAAIKARILSSVDPKAGLHGKTVTGGRLNAAKALGIPSISEARPTSKRRDRTPTISANVWDADTELTQTDIELYLDGGQISDFFYDQTSDTLSFTPESRLARHRHYVEVAVRDGDGLNTTHAWSFRVVRR